MAQLRNFTGLIAAVLVALPAVAQDTKQSETPEPLHLKPTKGPAHVSLGSVAELDLPELDVFLGKEDTRKLLERWGNITDGTELGLVGPRTQGQDWFIVFEYDDIGYIKDAANEKIDADALLKDITEGTEQSNEERKKHGHGGLHVTGWAEAPHYDPRTQNLTWATFNRTDNGHRGVNYNVRVLGRTGVMRITLVDDPDKLAASKPEVDHVLKTFSFQKGKTYAEWRPGDKVAKYGLTALVAAGAGAAAVKLGFFAMLGKLLAKMGKLVLVLVAAVGGALVKFWNALRGKFTARRPRRIAQAPGQEHDPDQEGQGGPGVAG